MKNKVNKNPIGLFDSGVGGLTVLQRMEELLATENLIYVGDNLNSPYGNKTKEQLYDFASRIVEYFINRQVKLIVLACNTTSSTILPKLQAAYPQVAIIGVIDSTVKDLGRSAVTKTLIIGTEATIRSDKYAQEIKRLFPQITAFSLATPQLVPLIESGGYDQVIEEVLRSYLDQYKNKIDSIVLGCTHYPILTKEIKKILPDIEYISSSEAIVAEVKAYLECKDMLNDRRDFIEIYTTGNVDEFYNSSKGFFPYAGREVKYIEL